VVFDLSYFEAVAAEVIATPFARDCLARELLMILAAVPAIPA
jgi:hypothetical protein